MSRRPHGPAKEGHPEQLPFRDPAKLKLRKTLNQHRDVEVALMINHENVLLPRIQVGQAIHFERNTADCEHHPRPKSADPINMLTGGIEKPNENRHESSWNRGHS